MFAILSQVRAELAAQEAANAQATTDYGSSTPGIVLPSAQSFVNPAQLAPSVNLIPVAPVLNANRPMEGVDSPVSPAVPGGPAMTNAPGVPSLGGAPQQLPPVNTVAKATNFDWKKYLPIGLVILVLLAVLYAATKKRG